MKTRLSSATPRTVAISSRRSRTGWCNSIENAFDDLRITSTVSETAVSRSVSTPIRIIPPKGPFFVLDERENPYTHAIYRSNTSVQVLFQPEPPSPSPDPLIFSHPMHDKSVDLADNIRESGSLLWRLEGLTQTLRMNVHEPCQAASGMIEGSDST